MGGRPGPGAGSRDLYLATVVHYSLLAIPRSNVRAWLGRSMMSHGVADLLLQVHREIERRARRR